MDTYVQSFYDIQVDNFEKDDFYGYDKIIDPPSPEDIKDIEDTRARYQLVESVCKKLGEVKGKLDNFFSPFHDPVRYKLPSDPELEVFKDILIDFSQKIDNPAYPAKLAAERERSRSLNRVIEEQGKKYREDVLERRAYFDALPVAVKQKSPFDILTVAQDIQKVHAESLIVSHNKEMRNDA